MNLSNLGIVISLLFPPSFVIALYYFDFNGVALIFSIVMLVYLIVSIVFKGDIKSVSTPLIYFSFVLLAYLLNSMELIKIIPALISMTFFFVFFIAYIQKKALILNLTQRFYKKELTPNKKSFLEQSDGYWAGVILLNTLIQIGLIFLENNEFWAFYSSIGWYVFLAIGLFFQVVYERLFLVKIVDIQ